MVKHITKTCQYATTNEKNVQRFQTCVHKVYLIRFVKTFTYLNVLVKEGSTEMIIC
jgi:hypothetical protein